MNHNKLVVTRPNNSNFFSCLINLLLCTFGA